MGWRRPFKADAGDCNSKKKKRWVGAASDSDSDSVAVGLRILIHLSKGDSDYILVKSKLKLNKPNFFQKGNRIPPSSYSCFLKSCFLCNKTLTHDKHVYMYRGDQGFCSEECRNRQIYVDEMKELETSTK